MGKGYKSRARQGSTKVSHHSINNQHKFDYLYFNKK